MPDVLIRNVPADDLALLDEQARRLGLSRTELIRRHLHAQARLTQVRVTPDNLGELSRLLGDLADPDVMGDAWS